MKMKTLCLGLEEPDQEGGDQAGFSLVELLISIGILSIFMVAIYTILLGQTRSYTTQEVAAGVQQTVRMGVEIMIEDLRLAGLDPKRTGGFGFESAQTTSVRITSDRIPEGQTEANGTLDNAYSERITYYYDSVKNTLEQRLYEGTPNQDTQTLIDNVTGVTFKYYNHEDVQLFPPFESLLLRDIRTVEVLLTVTEPAGRDGMLSRTYSTQVRCRNMGL